MKYNKKYMKVQEYDALVNECTKSAYEYTLTELENMIDTGYDCRNDYINNGPAKMVYQCNVVLKIFEKIFKERTQVMIRQNKIATIINDEKEDE